MIVGTENLAVWKENFLRQLRVLFSVSGIHFTLVLTRIEAKLRNQKFGMGSTKRCFLLQHTVTISLVLGVKSVIVDGSKTCYYW